MDKNEHSEGWVWVLVSDSGDDRHYLGLYSETQDINFIPAFPSREAASECYLDLPREKGKKYEIQAVHIDELSVDADKHGFAVALVDEDGKIIS